MRLGPFFIKNWKSKRSPNAGWDIRIGTWRLEIVSAYIRFTTPKIFRQIDREWNRE